MSFYLPANAPSTPTRPKPRMLHSIADSAIDADGSDVKAYIDSLDASHLRVLPGEELARFEVHPLDKESSDDVMNSLASATFERVGSAYWKACVRAMTLRLVDEVGESVVGTISGARLKEVDRSVQIEIGLYAHRLSERTPEGFFGPPPQSSAADLDT